MGFNLENSKNNVSPLLEKEDAIKVVTKSLEKLFIKYNDKGVVSICLWGSVTRDDYNPHYSDVDVLVIVDESFNLRDGLTMKKELEENTPEISTFGLQCVFISELNGGEKKSLLVRLHNPEYLLKSFNEWKFVCGERYRREDFSVSDFNVQEMMNHNIAEAQRALSEIDTPDPSRHPDASRKDFVKALSMFMHCHDISKKDSDKLFDDTLINTSYPNNKVISDILFEIRKNRAYSKEKFREYFPKLFKYFNEIKYQNR